MQSRNVNIKKDQRRRDLAKIHIAKKQLGLTDETYREMLQNVAGVDSAADLDMAGRMRVINHLKACGFHPIHKSAKASGMHRSPARERRPLLSKIGAILTDLSLPWSYADAMAKRMFGVYKARWLEPDQLRKLVGALIVHQQRENN